jgi:hypothetical protein
MQAHRINPDYTGRTSDHTSKTHPPGKGSIVVPVKLPKTIHVDGFPVESYVVSVTPSQPVIASINNQTRYGFDCTLTSPNGGAIAAGVLSVICIG